jgi:hypothetical protein
MPAAKLKKSIKSKANKSTIQTNETIDDKPTFTKLSTHLESIASLLKSPAQFFTPQQNLTDTLKTTTKLLYDYGKTNQFYYIEK